MRNKQLPPYRDVPGVCTRDRPGESCLAS